MLFFSLWLQLEFFKLNRIKTSEYITLVRAFFCRTFALTVCVCVCVCVYFLGYNLKFLPMSCKVVWNSAVVHLELSQSYGFNISHQCDCDQVHYGLRVYFLIYKLEVVIICTVLGWLRGPNKIKCVWALFQGSMPIKVHLTPQEGLHGGRPSLVPDERKGITTEEASGSGVASGPHTLLHLFNNIYWMPSMHLSDWG